MSSATLNSDLRELDVARLLAVLAPSNAGHPGPELGEFVAVCLAEGERAAAQAFPEVAEHLAALCVCCREDAQTVAELLSD
jgi:hypothetical protein